MPFTILPYEHSVHIGEVPNLVVISDENLMLVVWPERPYNETFTAKYTPDTSRRVTVNLTDIFRPYLKAVPPTESVTPQPDVYKKFFFRVIGLTSGQQRLDHYSVLLSSTATSLPADMLMASQFLTQQPQSKNVTSVSPEFLTLNGAEHGSGLQLIARFHTANGPANVRLEPPTASGVNTVRITWNEIRTLFTGECDNSFDIVAVRNGMDVMLQSYILTPGTERDRYFLWVNALGGIDTIRCTGDNSLQPIVTYNIGMNNGVAVQLDDTDDYIEWHQNSGWFPWRQREWIADFITSKQGHWIYDPESETLTPIAITSSKLEAPNSGQLFSFSFSYRLAGKPVATLPATSRCIEYTDDSRSGSVCFISKGDEARIHLEGTGDITIEVSVDGNNYTPVNHHNFTNGVAVIPVKLFVGDYVRLSATSLTKVIVNYNVSE